MTKYAIIIPDGAADDPLEQLNGQTALEAARISNIDKISISEHQDLIMDFSN